MKKVALISDGWKRLIIYAWADGIMIRMNKHTEEICLHHFNCYGNWSSDELHNQGEYNLFNLPHLKNYDGIILDCNNIADKTQLNYLADLVRESGVPAISIARDIEGFYYVGIDNEKPINEMMEHMYNVHSCRSFVFAGGPLDNYENDCRVKAYKASIKKFGLNEEDNPVFYGDYDFNTGASFFRNYIASGRTLPDVIVCACDNIAVGVCSEAERMGYRVPEDIKVTGFDNLDKAVYFKPQIATVDHHDRGKISGKCIDILIDIWEGRKPERYNFTGTKCIFGESCGCENNGLVDYREYIKGLILYGIHKFDDDERISKLESNISKYMGFSQIYQCMNEFMSGYDCDGFFIIIDDALNNVSSDRHFLTKGYDEKNMSVVFAYDDGREHKFNTVSELYSYLDKTGGRNEYLFTPIHFRQYSVGYTIVKNARFLYDNPNFYDLHNIIVKALEGLYSYNKLEQANRKLKDIYNKDQLTGIYNRVAYAEFITPAFEKYYNNNIVCAVGFVDVDKFKHINDTYGHEYGDDVLRKVAEILSNVCPKDSYVCRYGGDEFIFFFPNATKELANIIKKEINKEADKINIKLSIGVVLSSEDHGSNINCYFKAADQYMYEEKIQHKMKLNKNFGGYNE